MVFKLTNRIIAVYSKTKKSINAIFHDSKEQHNTHKKSRNFSKIGWLVWAAAHSKSAVGSNRPQLSFEIRKE
jgi:hypothetical protein